MQNNKPKTIKIKIDDLIKPLGKISTIRRSIFNLFQPYEEIEVFNAFHYTIKIEKIDETNYKKMLRIDIHISDKGF